MIARHVVLGAALAAVLAGCMPFPQRAASPGGGPSSSAPRYPYWCRQDARQICFFDQNSCERDEIFGGAGTTSHTCDNVEHVWCDAGRQHCARTEDACKANLNGGDCQSF